MTHYGSPAPWRHDEALRGAIPTSPSGRSFNRTTSAGARAELGEQAAAEAQRQGEAAGVEALIAELIASSAAQAPRSQERETNRARMAPTRLGSPSD